MKFHSGTVETIQKDTAGQNLVSNELDCMVSSLSGCMRNTTLILKSQETLWKRGKKDCKGQRTRTPADRVFLLYWPKKLHL